MLSNWGGRESWHWLEEAREVAWEEEGGRGGGRGEEGGALPVRVQAVRGPALSHQEEAPAFGAAWLSICKPLPSFCQIGLCHQKLGVNLKLALWWVDIHLLKLILCEGKATQGKKSNSKIIELQAFHNHISLHQLKISDLSGVDIPWRFLTKVWKLFTLDIHSMSDLPWGEAGHRVRGSDLLATGPAWQIRRWHQETGACWLFLLLTSWRGDHDSDRKKTSSGRERRIQTSLCEDSTRARPLAEGASLRSTPGLTSSLRSTPG